MPETLYPYPFDAGGHDVLTLEESVAALRDLEHQLNEILPSGWRWQELRFATIERHHKMVIYRVKWNGEEVGKALVLASKTSARMRPQEDQR
jgi:hypothetical protein